MRWTIIFASLATMVHGLSLPMAPVEKRCLTNIECLREREAKAAANPRPVITNAAEKKARAIRASASPTSTSLLGGETSKADASSTSTVSSEPVTDTISTSPSFTSTFTEEPSITSTTSSSSSSASSIPAASPTGILIDRPSLQRISLLPGRYDLAAWGAQGGGGEGTQGVFIPGGSAANFNVSVIVDAPLDIVAVVGSTGGDEPPERARGGCGGGGGGSFLYTVANEPLLMAGGGGGSCFSGMARDPPANGAASAGLNSKGGAAGQNGQGGGIAVVDPGVGGGGAGFLSSGMPESNPASGRSKDLDFRGGSPANPFGGGPGGFGGGGAGGGGGGGGGGYSGGGAGQAGFLPGGNGGSYFFSPRNVPGGAVASSLEHLGGGKIYIFGPY